MRISRIALLCLLIVIPLGADDEHDIKAATPPLENDPSMVHPDDVDLATEAVAAAARISPDADEVSEEDAENDVSDQSASSSTQALHEQIVNTSGGDDEKDVTGEKIEDDVTPQSATRKSQEESREDYEKDGIGEASSVGGADDVPPTSSTSQDPQHSNTKDETQTEAAVQEESSAGEVIEPDRTATEDEGKKEDGAKPKKRTDENKSVTVDYANKSTGALILDRSPNFQGTSNLLVSDKDKYAMIPCEDEDVKYVIVGLSEDILVKSIKLSSVERFSSLTKQFQVLGSQTYPMMTEWESLGTFVAKPWYKENKQQTFDIEVPSWARYLKFRFLSHYGDEHYCTVTQIKVHGSTTLQGYHEMQLVEKEAEARAEEEAGGTSTTVEEEEAITKQSSVAASEKEHVEAETNPSVQKVAKSNEDETKEPAEVPWK